jgi:hypothetical protein
LKIVCLAGTAGAADSGAAAIGQLRAEAQALMGELCAAGSMGSLQGAFALPVVVGPNGQLQFVQHMPHFPVASAASPPQHQQQLSWPVRIIFASQAALLIDQLSFWGNATVVQLSEVCSFPEEGRVLS